MAAQERPVGGDQAGLGRVGSVRAGVVRPVRCRGRQRSSGRRCVRRAHLMRANMSFPCLETDPISCRRDSLVLCEPALRARRVEKSGAYCGAGPAVLALFAPELTVRNATARAPDSATRFAHLSLPSAGSHDGSASPLPPRTCLCHLPTKPLANSADARRSSWPVSSIRLLKASCNVTLPISTSR